MSPRLRLAMHQALDIVLDAVEAEASDPGDKPKRTRTVKAPELPKASEAARAAAVKAWEKQGFHRPA